MCVQFRSCEVEETTKEFSGALDNAPSGKPKEGEALVNYVEKAVGELKAGKPVTTSETRSYG